MPVSLTPDALARLFPRARPEIIAEIHESQSDHFARHEITKTRARLAYFLAQAAEESGGFTVFEEKLSYTAQRLVQVWPGRFPTIAAAAPYARNPQRLANKVYGGRMGNGPEASGDGWRFRGRGPIQLTGRANYKAVGELIGLDLAGNPDLALEPDTMMRTQAGYWALNRLNRYADRGAFQLLSNVVNTGSEAREAINSRLRQEWLRKVLAEMARPGSLADGAALPQPRPVAPVPPQPDVPLPEPAPARPRPPPGGWRASLAAFFRRIFGGRP